MLGSGSSQHNEEKRMRQVRGSDYSQMVFRAANLADTYEDADELDPDADDLLHGRLVSWKPTSYDIVRIPARYVVAPFGNEWDWDWLNYLYNKILNRNAVLETGYGTLSVIGLTDIAETQQAEMENRLDIDYTLSEPWTTGNEEWDKVIVGWDANRGDLARIQQELEEAYRDSESQEELEEALVVVDDELTEEIGVTRTELNTLLGA
ncbi:hypothetical protein LCGC14_2194070, partial [marine sediment metagenome]